MFKLIDKKLLLTPVSGIGGKRYGQFQTKLEKGEKDSYSECVLNYQWYVWTKCLRAANLCACLFIRAQRVINKW